jgi:hypothetical protein
MRFDFNETTLTVYTHQMMLIQCDDDLNAIPILRVKTMWFQVINETFPITNL